MAVAIPLWAMQGIIARAFYAVGDTWSPMVAGTVVTAISIPIYATLFHTFGPSGLVVASGIGIALHTASLLYLLPRRLADCDRRALLLGVARASLLGALAAFPAALLARFIPVGHLGGHATDLVQLGLGGLVFLTVIMLLMRPLAVEDAAALFDRVAVRLTRNRGS